ncbi:hypothetical protein ACTGJ9_039510 [Bradyrhizobium sp. RDM12]
MIALTLSPMMCCHSPPNTEEAASPSSSTGVWRAELVRCRLDRSLDYKAITGLFAVTILGLVGLLHVEGAGAGDQGIVFVATKAPKYATSYHVDFYAENSTRNFEADCASC